MEQYLKQLEAKISGDLYFDKLLRSIYATDASVYRILPLAVAYPQTKEDIKELINFARKHNTSLIPRTAGTSLSGQCVGKGIVVDVSKYFTKIISFNEEDQTVTVQPGVVRDELNNYLKTFGLFFGPNTSTSNRCMIGGMVGNNSSGTTSIKYGVTRDKVVELKTILSDGSEVTFNSVNTQEYHEKSEQKTLEGAIYSSIFKELSKQEVQEQIKTSFPKPEIHRRNTGYAIDELIKLNPFSTSNESFNMCRLLTGSEGTLAFTTEITLKLDKLQPIESIMIAAHFESISSCMKAVEKVMAHNLYTCEMMDKIVLDCTKHNKKQQDNRQFIVGNPAVILMCEVRADSKGLANQYADELVNTLEQSKLSYANPKLVNEDINKAMELRKAGLGLLGNMIGDEKSVACIEDTAVALPDLFNYIEEFTALMNRFNQKAIYYAHAGAGELHLRPILNLKKEKDVKLFRTITTEVARLVKKYNGSMSGEHGDGIVRAEFIPFMIGENNYKILKRIKTTFDPQNIFNPGKIVDALPMNKSLRYEKNRIEPEIDTILDFSASQGILREAEKCNGSGDCRKLKAFGGTMCPSYRATRNEKDSTRARANALREFLTNSEKSNRFDHKELKDVFDLCLSCKACASECPSSVDVASLKAEFEYQYQKSNGFSFKDSFFAYATKYNKKASKFPKLYNSLSQNKVISSLVKKVLGIHKNRSLPKVSILSFSSYYKVFQKLNSEKSLSKKPKQTVCLFVDEFTNYLESEIAIDSLTLLETLGYNVIVVDYLESGRAYISKGFLNEAKYHANYNINALKDIISPSIPLIGIEPSAIITFKDEYIKLANSKDNANSIANNTLLIEDFIYNEFLQGNIKSEFFTDEILNIMFHGHCHQKALSNQSTSTNILSIPKNYKVETISSGCCGMAGSFGYKKEYFETSMQIGEQSLFPAIRNSSKAIISANGTSCRHQIKDGTNTKAKHPITILKEALI